MEEQIRAGLGSFLADRLFMAEPTPVLLMVSQLTTLGGSERQAFEIAKTLDRRRFQVFVGTTKADNPRKAELEAAGIPVFHFPVTSLMNATAISAASKLRKFVRERGIKLVHSFDLPSNIFAAPAARWAEVPVVLTSQRGSRLLFSGLQRRLLQITDPMAHGIIANCEAMRKHLVEDEGVDPAKIEICYNGIDIGVFAPADEPHPEQLKDARFVVGTVCALRAEKGLDTLVDAFSRATLPAGSKLLIVGSGVLEQSLREQVARLNLQESTVFLPAQQNVRQWYRAIDIFVLPSISEALSNSIMEAMACRSCVVASNVGGNPELITHEKTGLLFESRNSQDLAGKITRLAQDDRYRQALAEAGCKRMRDEFSIEASAKRMGEIYSKALNARA